MRVAQYKRCMECRVRISAQGKGSFGQNGSESGGPSGCASGTRPDSLRGLLMKPEARALGGKATSRELQGASPSSSFGPDRMRPVRTVAREATAVMVIPTTSRAQLKNASGSRRRAAHPTAPTPAVRTEARCSDGVPKIGRGSYPPICDTCPTALADAWGDSEARPGMAGRSLVRSHGCGLRPSDRSPPAHRRGRLRISKQRSCLPVP